MKLVSIELIAAFLLLAEITSASVLSKLPRTSDDFAAPPAYLALKAKTLSDDAFAFRLNALELQHAGNLNGDIIPYNKLNYAHLGKWLTLLDRLDSQSQITPTMASYLFGNSQNGADTRYVIDYLERRALANPIDNWRWLAESVYLARYKLHDLPRAQTLAHELSSMPISLPPWARELEIFVLVQRGENAQAKVLLDRIASDDTTPENEKRWAQVYSDRNLQGSPSWH